jgi:hypothetical protein
MRSVVSLQQTALLLCGAAALVGCTLMTPSDGLSGGGLTGSETSGGGNARARDGGSSDSAGSIVTTGGTGDLGDTTPDGGTNGNVDASTSSSSGGVGVSFCATSGVGTFLCADFDDGKVPSVFTPFTLGNGTAAPVTADPRSAPYAVLFTAPASANSVGASLRTGIPAGKPKITLDVDVKVDNLGAPHDYDFLTLTSGVPQMGVQVNPDGTLSFDEQYASGSGANTAMGASMPIAVWTHLRWVIEVSGSSALTHVYIDNALVGTHTFDSAATIGSSPVRLDVGDAGQQALTQAWHVRVDNVTVDLR